MRWFSCVTLFGAVLVGTVPVYADVQSYCAAYGVQAATMRLTGRSILDPSVTPQLSEAQRAAASEAATAHCLARFAPTVEAEAPLKARAAAAPRSKSALQPGSGAWNAYCAKKYASFDAATGTYTARSGKRRSCVVGKG